LSFNFHLWKCGYPIQFSIWSVTCSSLVQEDMSHGIHKVIHKWIFFFGTEGIWKNAYWLTLRCLCIFPFDLSSNFIVLFRHNTHLPSGLKNFSFNITDNIFHLYFCSTMSIAHWVILFSAYICTYVKIAMLRLLYETNIKVSMAEFHWLLIKSNLTILKRNVIMTWVLHFSMSPSNLGICY